MPSVFVTIVNAHLLIHYYSLPVRSK